MHNYILKFYSNGFHQRNDGFLKNGFAVSYAWTAGAREPEYSIYKWQHGTALPTVDNLVLLSAIFKVSIDEILVVEQCGGIALSASA